MALVAYSDDSDITASEEETEVVEKNGECNELTSNVKATTALVNEVRPESVSKPQDSSVQSGIDSIIDEDEDKPAIIATENGGLLSSIPRARSQYDMDTNEIVEEEEITDVPTVGTWEVTKNIADVKVNASVKDRNNGNTTAKTKKRKKIQFFVPSLAELADDEEEEVPEKSLKKPSSKGSGLFSLLPQPKALVTKTAKRSLVPHVLTKQPPAPVRSKVQSKHAPKSSTTKAVRENILASDSDEEGDASDFFSLSAPVSVPVPDVITTEITTSLKSTESDALSTVLPSSQNSSFMGGPVFRDSTTEETQHRREPLSNEYNQPSLPSYSGAMDQPDFYPLPSSEPNAFDKEALQRLTGRRKHKGEEIINMVDVSADDALLSRDEWMMKALTEEKPTHSYSKKREGVPTQTQKRKHQITYLAHQAKERELELKNNWAENRMTKMQTQAKYGF
ncbi:proline-rich protein PRCC [Oratosquilla oratoria]|uniref:proline-rich protein PRCC n=1 Tax=Oratosquilla oratoria TaxID=337810 RepID=UPI003F76AED6